MRDLDDEGGAPGSLAADREQAPSAPDTPQSEGSAGSNSFDDPDRPLFGSDAKIEAKYDYHLPCGGYAYTVIKGRRPNGEKVFLKGQLRGGNDLQIEKQDDHRAFFSFAGLGNYRKGAGDQPDLLYRLPDLLAAKAEQPDAEVYLCEGEKDVETLRALDLNATTNPNGALNWKAEFNAYLAGLHVVIPVDNDDRGRQRGADILRTLLPIARSVKVVELPGLKPHGDVTDWLDGGKTKADLLAVVSETQPGKGPEAENRGVRLEDFHAFMPAHNYIFGPSGEAWPSSSVNSRIKPVPLFNGNGQPVLDDDGEQVKLIANRWLDEHRPVEQMTWAPGSPQVINDRLISEGGWIDRLGCNVFNLYRPPARLRGDKNKAGPWLDHVQKVYPGEADHIINWLAHRVQRPDEKINHAVVMGGAQGIGKDTILEPVKAAIGPWNFIEVSPQHMLGRFNGFVKSVILRVSEARDLGDVDRFAFYDHMKTYTAAPPDVLRVDEKYRSEYAVFNVCGVIITSNHKTNGLYLPEDDRRHFVAWSDATKDDFAAGYWEGLWAWYQNGGTGHVAAYLAAKDISEFNAKAPPPKTEAFWDIVASNSAPEDAELSDALEKLGNPAAVTLSALIEVAEQSFADWLKDRKNSRRVPHKLEECGYRPVRNPNAKAGRWKVGGKDMVVYVRKELSIRDAITAAEKRATEGNNVPF